MRRPQPVDLIGAQLAAGALVALAVPLVHALMAVSLLGAAVLAVTRRRGGPALLISAALIGCLVGGLRLEALADAPLAPRLGESIVDGRAVVGEAWRGSGRGRMAIGELVDGGPVLLRLDSASPPIRGSIVRVDGTLVRPRSSETGFDEAQWLARQGVYAVLRIRRYQVVGMRGGAWGVADRLRAAALGSLEASGSGDAGAVVRGLAFGADAGMSAQAVAAFRASGLAHLLAVSGGNVALLVALVLLVVWVAGGSRRQALALALVAIAVYLAIVGPSPSVMRAGIAGWAGCLALVLGRPRDAWRAMGLGAGLLLVWNPHAVVDPGLQLSFAAVAAILLIGPYARRISDAVPVPFVVVAAALVTGAATLATAPISWWHFGQAALIASVPANLLAAPAVPLALWAAIAATVVHPLVPAAGAGIAWCAQWPAAWILLCANGGERLAQAVPTWVLPAGAGGALLGLAWRLGSGGDRAAPQARLPARGLRSGQGAARGRAAARTLRR